MTLPTFHAPVTKDLHGMEIFTAAMIAVSNLALLL